MHRSITLIACEIAFLLFCSISFAEGERKMEAINSKGQKVKEALEQKHLLTNAVSYALHDPATLDLKTLFEKRKYQLGIVQDILTRPGKFMARSMEWNTEKKSHAEQIRLVIVYGENNPVDAQEGLFEIMGAGTTMMITPSTFEVLKDGPGDICFIMAVNLKGGQNNPVVSRKIWFSRDNIAVELSNSGDMDLLPIAKAIDQAVRSCLKK